MNDTLCIIFAKAPVPGEVKTRLIPAIGEMGAAMLHSALTERAIENAQSLGAPVELACAPDLQHAFFDQCAEDFGVTLAPQGDGDLGARMLRALQRGLKSHGNVLLAGADAPALGKKEWAAARAALDAHDVVLIPADDGGYVLIGARATHAHMFDAIAWGTSGVLAQQRAAL
ncbi:MAG: TIGR04282 family arsenosugar biosynthesis glycosyltransferase, partial [Betaproteobacteria bacterium]|nr:TIGR04282 family arsenosugar biosynthesis glycosyltransferase [Betaproteobacteria bacterium]